MDYSKEIIDSLGGPAELSRKLGFTTQRVWNWTKYGIPGKVWKENRKMFDSAERAVVKKEQA